MRRPEPGTHASQAGNPIARAATATHHSRCRCTDEQDGAFPEAADPPRPETGPRSLPQQTRPLFGPLNGAVQLPRPLKHASKTPEGAGTGARSAATACWAAFPTRTDLGAVAPVSSRRNSSGQLGRRRKQLLRPRPCDSPAGRPARQVATTPPNGLAAPSTRKSTERRFAAENRTQPQYETTPALHSDSRSPQTRRQEPGTHAPQSGKPITPAAHATLNLRCSRTDRRDGAIPVAANPIPPATGPRLLPRQELSLWAAQRCRSAAAPHSNTLTQLPKGRGRGARSAEAAC
jgi:hypothetical protein